MRVPLTWLNEYVTIPCDLETLCDRLDLTGTGVEAIDVVGEAFEQVVTGQIRSKEAHPNADRLWVTMVDVGEHNVDENGRPAPLQIVCGAQNFKAGDHVVVALVGATLPGDFRIKKSKLRGVTSYGMNCSERELGLGSNHEGIMILPDDAPVGIPFAKYQKTAETVLDLEVTPNRPDCLSLMGMAREVGAICRTEVTPPVFNLQEAADQPAASELATVEIADEGRCARYTARVICNVTVGPSPDWLAQRVIAAGARSVNNVVDATNYILFLLGQPLHAFDFDKIVSSDGKAHIVVRAAKENEEFTTLDGEVRTLTEDATLIATPERAIALAGVMGGLDSEITDKTTTVLLETATFDPAHTSRTSRNLSLISESSIRYERGVDDNPLADNADAAAALLAEVSGGVVCPGLVDVWVDKTEPVRLTFRTERFNALMGVDIAPAESIDLLQRLGCEVSVATRGETPVATPAEAPGESPVATSGETPTAETAPVVLDVRVPTFRPDLEREIDLYEEVLRLWGMDRVVPTLPASSGRVGLRTANQTLDTLINLSLRASGLNETTTYSFAEANEMKKLRMPTDDTAEAVELLNPMNAEQSVMRQSIIPGLLRSVAYNQSHGVENVQLYEIGTVFTAREGKKQPKEQEKVAGMLAGSMNEAGWNVNERPFDFFDGKGVVENLMRELAVPKLRFKVLDPHDALHLQPGRAAQVLSAGSVLGWVGELHPLAVDAFEAQAPVVAFELDKQALASAARPARDYVDVPTFPAVDMDVAFVVDESTTNETMMQRISSAGGTLLERVHLFDVYRDEERVGQGKKSMAYALTYRASDHTLTSEAVEKAHNKLIKKVCKATGAEVRS